MTGTEAHPPSPVLAELAEGVLDAAQEREVRAHVEECLTCQAAIDELARVTVALGALPAELPIPEFVAARISHALAAERSSGATPATASATAPGAEGGTVAWFRRRLPQGLAAAASVAVVGLAGYVVVSGGTGGGSDGAGDSAEVAAGAAPSNPPPRSVGPRIGSAQAAPDEQTQETPADSTYDGGDELTTASGVDEAELQAAVESIVRQRPTGGPRCGEELSEELGQPVVGAEPFEAGVLIVLEGATTYDGWLLDTCHSYSTATLEPQVQVPKAE